MLVGLVGLAAVVMAARSQTPVQPPADTAVRPMDSTIVDTMVQDSLMVDSLTIDREVQMSLTTQAIARSAAPAQWPVDPATGMTLVNGEPVVGRVFIMAKVDGLTKYENVASVLAPEPMPPQAPVVGSSYAAPPLEATRRHRSIMVQATLWSFDNKPSAVERRYYRPATSGESLGQQY